MPIRISGSTEHGAGSSHRFPALTDSPRQFFRCLGCIEHPYLRSRAAPCSVLRAQLMSKPRVLAFRVTPGGYQYRVPQRTLGHLAVQHRDHLPIPDPVEPRCVRGNPGVQLPLHFADESRRQHLIDTRGEPAVQYLARNSQLNVPGTERRAFARLPLPPRERVSGQQRDFDGPGGALAAAAQELGVEPARPAREVGTLERLGPLAQLRPAVRVERRLAKQPLGQGADVEPSAADHYWLAVGGPHGGNPRRGIARKTSRTV